MSGATVRLDKAAFAWEDMAMLFDADIAAGEMIAVMGPSGAGKSTLLNLVAGFEQPVSGRVLIGGQDMGELGPGERPVSMVFQENNLFGHLDLFANVALGRSPALRLSASDRKDIMAAIARAGLEGKEKRRPAELSGGERQRAALARAALRDRPVLLLDEPFAALDPALRSDMLELLAELHRQSGMTVLVVTHQPADALALKARVLFVESGRIAADGPAAFLLGDNAPEAIRRYRGLD